MNFIKGFFNKKKKENTDTQERAYDPNKRPYYDIQPVFNDAKKAIFIGLNYPNSFYTLRGCINDIHNGSEYLANQGYKTKLLTDVNISKKFSIIQTLIELRQFDGKNVFFHYSGHGSQVKDTNGDEEDGMDEGVCMSGRIVTDDEINHSLSLFPRVKNLIMVFDCCHSGSIADLPYTIKGRREVSQKGGKEIKANVICISGCKDEQTSADICDQNLAYGALSATFYKLLREQTKPITWKNFYFKLLKEMEKNKYDQIPVISASNPKIFNQKMIF